MINKRLLGRSGEDCALHYLKEKGYLILEKNFRTRLGEIDIIAKDNRTICFIEVKTRTSSRFGHPLEAITLSKQAKIVRLAMVYLKIKGLNNLPVRFDVVTIMKLAEGHLQVHLLKNAFAT